MVLLAEKHISKLYSMDAPNIFMLSPALQHLNAIFSAASSLRSSASMAVPPSAWEQGKHISSKERPEARPCLLVI